MVFSASFAAICLAVFFLSKLFDRRILFVSAVLATVYLTVDDFVTGLPHIVKSLAIFGGQWNWEGKILSLLFSAVVVIALSLSPEAVGLTFKQRHVKIGIAAVIGFVFWGLCLGFFFQPGIPNAETLAFQATMPGLAEELAYRGIAPALLLGLMGRKEPIDGIPWTVIFATAIVFGVWHGLNYSHGQFGFTVMAALFPFIGSIPGGWLRFKTGSLLFPILCHSIANVAFHVAGGLAR